MQLRIFVEGKGWLGPYVIPATGCDAEPSVIDGSVREDAIVQAELVDITSGTKYETDDYRLQLAYNPCKTFDRVIHEDSDKYSFRYVHKDKNGKKVKDKQANLFWGAMGPSLLRLCKRNADTDDYEEIWRASITIDPLPDRRRVMLAMIADLLPINPYLALSSAWGLSKLSVRRQWKGESVSLDLWSALIEYETTKWLFDDVSPHLYGIMALPAEAVSRRCTIAKVRSLRRLTTATTRQICRKATMGARMLGDAIVVADTLSSHADILAHRIIGDFLQCRLRRLEVIEQKFRMLIKEGEKELADPMSGGDRKGYFKHVVANEGDILKKITVLRNAIGASYVSGPWFGLRCGPSVLSVDPAEFEYGSSYRYVYMQMSSFAKMQFVWNSASDPDSVRKTMHEEVVDDYKKTMPNLWVHNYTVVYEGWCFIQLLKALKKFGFDMLDGYRSCVVKNAIDAYMGQKHNFQFELRSKCGSVVVELCYGCAFPPLTKECTGFCHVKRGTQDPLTPDFSMRIRRADSDDMVYALILDAKSGRELTDYEIRARENIESCIRKNADDGVDQVWLIYAGKLEDSESHLPLTAGIEFSSMDGNDYWKYDHSKFDSCAKKNGTFVWSRKGISQRGLLRKFSRKDAFVGHVRVNSVTGKDGSVFKEFIEGVLNTAYHVLGLI